MSKRGNGEGSITKRKDGRWMGRVTVPGSGRRTVYGKTRKEVADEINKLLGKVRDGLPVGDKTTVGEFLTRWLEDSAKPSVRPRTAQSYEYIVHGHIAPAIGKIALHKLTSADVQWLYSAKHRAGLSPSTVTRIHAVLHRALEQATKWGLVARNVAALADRPKQSGREIKPLSPTEARALLEEAKGDRLEALFTLALTTGMRQGELLGLRWQDVDLDTGRLYVRQTLDSRNGKFTFGEPKTRGSQRAITLTKMALTSLKAHKARQAEERLRAGVAWQDFGLVFTTKHGTPIQASNLVRQVFKPLLKEAGLPDIRFHDLRHSCASALFAANVHPKKVQELLGHSQISITLNTYSHVLPTMHDEIADELDRLLGTA